MCLRVAYRNEKPYHFPAYVEACGGPIERVPGAAAYRCANRSSFSQLKRRLEYFASRRAFDIEGLGPKIVELLMREGLVASADDFFTLTKGDLLELSNFGEKSADNLLRAISERRSISLPRFLTDNMLARNSTRSCKCISIIAHAGRALFLPCLVLGKWSRSPCIQRFVSWRKKCPIATLCNTKSYRKRVY